MTNESSANAIIGNTLRIIASGEYHPGAELTQKMASYIIEPEQKLTDMAEQLANAESKCRELAAENATMKECTSDVMKHVYRSKTYLDSNRVVDAIQGLQCAIERKAGKTTATDAFLAEVRAQGVEIYADNLDSSADDAERDGFDDAVKFLRSEASGVRLFAAQLRKGAAL
ncbi:hypothetical protein [Citrobacter freundii]|uniref:hypothetical protein n=1 Tax=Citrobacter freundii TaxID=546 RepID=UPI001FFE0595|nr:hypothetical protein [Citrobacter freundii]